MKIVPLENSTLSVLVDDEDYIWLVSYKWWLRVASTYKYAFTRDYRFNNKSGVTIQMHRMLLFAPGHLMVDHIDGNGLNNQKGNLRLSTRGQNIANSNQQVRTKSGHKGVYRAGKGWTSMIRKDKELIYLGYFSTIEEAAKAYNTAAVRLHGEFAKSPTLEVQNA